MKILKHIAALALIIAPAFGARADESAQASPYSMMGYGVLNDHVSASQRAMGGIGYALRSKRQINVKNPASYAAIDSMTFLFDIGANVGSGHFSQDGLSSNKTLGGLDYVTLQVPIGKWMGASAGLLPYSSTGYRFGTEIVNGESAYQGSGGVSEAYIGFAARPVKGLSIGFNAGYLFGNIINDVYVNASNGASSLYERVMKVRDYNIQFGLQYGVDIARNHSLTLGVAYTLGHKTHGTGYGVKYDISTTSATTADTIGYTALVHGFTTPHTIGAGLAYQWDKRLTIGVDFTYQPWAKAKSVTWPTEWNVESTRFANRYQVGLGASYTPSVRGSYFRRVTYRAGAFFNRDYVMVGDNNVRDYGVSCGFGFPTVSDKSIINLGFEYRHRQAHPNPMVKENYFCVRLGINFNELWFFQNKLR